MRTGILYKPTPGLTLSQAVQQAVTLFRHSAHCNGLEPAEARFNPGDLPAGHELLNPGGLAVLPDPQVRLGHIRITTAEVETA